MWFIQRLLLTAIFVLYMLWTAQSYYPTPDGQLLMFYLIQTWTFITKTNGEVVDNFTDII